MGKTIIITGINGHLGHALVEQFLKQDVNIRGLIYKNSKIDPHWLGFDKKMLFIRGDIRDKNSLTPLFEGLEDQEVYVIHTASLIDIQNQVLTEELVQINVNGTKNVLDLAREYNVRRMIYVSSVDSFEACGICADESSRYASDSKCGGYALSKKMANEECLKYREEGLDVVIIYSTAFIGPDDNGKNHLVQLMKDYLNGTIPGVIKGGYDMADVRDIARGIITALFSPLKEESFILSGSVISLKNLLLLTGMADGHKRNVRVFPTYMAYLGLPFVKVYCKKKRIRPLYTAFALSVIKNANTFDCSKAIKELNYVRRPFVNTIKDTVNYLVASGQVK